MSDRLDETELYIILADYSNDLAALKKRDGELPAQAAVKRINSYIDSKIIEARIDELNGVNEFWHGEEDIEDWIEQRIKALNHRSKR